MDADLNQLLGRCSELRMVVVGDVMLDHYIYGDVSRISPEAPVPVVRVSEDRHVPGGAANVAANLAGLGIPVTLLGVFGDDPQGRRLASLLSGQGIELSPLGERAGISTTVKTRVVACRQQLCRIDREENPAALSLAASLRDGEFAALLDPADAVVLSDYAKGVIDDALLGALRERRRHTSGSPWLVLDPKPRRGLDIGGMDLITPNLAEAMQLAGLDPAETGIPDEELCRRIHQAHAPARLAVTLGPMGMLLCEGGRVLGRRPTQAREVFDVSGAGDTVAAVLAAGLAAGLSFEQAAGLANRAAGIVVSHLGTTPIRAAELTAGI